MLTRTFLSKDRKTNQTVSQMHHARLSLFLVWVLHSKGTVHPHAAGSFLPCSYCKPHSTGMWFPSLPVMEPREQRDQCVEEHRVKGSKCEVVEQGKMLSLLQHCCNTEAEGFPCAPILTHFLEIYFNTSFELLMSYKVKSFAKNQKSTLFCSQIQDFSRLMYWLCFHSLARCFNQLINCPSFCYSPCALVQ